MLARDYRTKLQGAATSAAPPEKTLQRIDEMFTEMDEILKQSLNCFVATTKAGGVRFGVIGILINESNNPEVVERALEISKIADEDKFEDEVTELFAVGHTGKNCLSV